MKSLAVLLLTFFTFEAIAQNVYVDGYTRSDGTYVAPHVRSAPDSSKWNNYGEPSSLDRQEERDVFNRDYDRDGQMNQYDYDDDNDGDDHHQQYHNANNGKVPKCGIVGIQCFAKART